MPNMSLGGSSGSAPRKSTKNLGAAKKLITLKNIAKQHEDAGRPVPKAVTDGIRNANREMGN